MKSAKQMRTRSITILVLLLFLYSCSGREERFILKSDKISIEYDKNFNFKILWIPADRSSIVAFDTAVQSGIKVDGKLISKFKLDRKKSYTHNITDEEFGPGIESKVNGLFEEGDIKIERETRILLAEKFPDAVIFNTTYHNLSDKRIHIDTIFSQKLLLKNMIDEQFTDSGRFASFQGGINEWGRDYELIWLTPGFKQDNFQGMHYTEKTEYIGGGMPFVDVWNKEMGVAIMHIEKQPEWLSLPVKVQNNGTTEISIVEEPIEEYGMKEWLNPNDSIQTVQNAIIFHNLDFFDPLNTYGELLRCRGINIQKTSPEKAYEPYWKSWGFGMNFTLEKIYNVLPELRAMGINIANLDDGWFDYYGDWNVNRSIGKFPGGEKDIIAFVQNIHKEGFKTNLWWYPFGVSPDAELAREHIDLLVQSEDGSYPLDDRGVYKLCPAYKPAIKCIEDMVIRFTTKWGFDGLYVDSRGLAGVYPCFNKAHNHTSPMESFRAVPQVYKVIYETLQKYNIDAFQEVCICATPHSPYNMPYYQIASASDPVDLFQVRRRVKAEKAIHGPTFCVGDCYQIPKDEFKGVSACESFESAMGTGAQVTTFYKDLDSTQFLTWKKWIEKYRVLELSRAEYVNLYDIAFDFPETHVLKKGDELFFGFYAESWSKERDIVLRGLKKGVDYSIYDYSLEQKLGTVNGSSPVLNLDFNNYLLLRLKPL